MNEETQYVWVVKWPQYPLLVFKTRAGAERWLESYGAGRPYNGGHWALWYAIDEDGEEAVIYLNRVELAD